MMIPGDNSGKSKTRPAKTRDLIRTKALEQGSHRTEAVVAAVRAAMKTIEKDIDAHDGIYPANKGALSRNEVYRRAGIHNTTLYDDRYKSLRADLTAWFNKIKETSVTGRGRVRREISSRVADWRQRYEGVVNSHRKTELDLQEAERKLEAAEDSIAKLTKDNERLQQALIKATAGKVVAIHRKTKSS